MARGLFHQPIALRRGLASPAIALAFSLTFSLANLVSSSAEASENPQHSCMATHLQEAIKQNKERLSCYSAITDGKSVHTSSQLIQSETLSLLVAAVLDARAKPFQKKGIAILCDEFVSMSETPAFDEGASYLEMPLQAPAIRKESYQKWSNDLKQSLKTGGFKAVAKRGTLILDQLSKQPRYFCMARHLLESIVRGANLAPLHMQKARAKGLKSTESLSRDFMQLQIWALSTADSLDRSAAEIQKHGVPIVCQDVPAIPLLP